VRSIRVRRAIGPVAGQLILLLLASCFRSTASAQSCHPLQGTWRLSLRASQMGPSLSFNPYHTIRAVQLRLSEDAGRIRESWVFSGQHLQETWTYAFSPNGEPQPTHTKSVLYSVPTSVTATWQNCTLVVDGHSSLFGRQISTMNIYVFSPDGKTLTIIQSVNSPVAHQSRRLVFRRTQPAGSPGRNR
jgi:hypothetical protein